MSTKIAKKAGLSFQALPDYKAPMDNGSNESETRQCLNKTWAFLQKNYESFDFSDFAALSANCPCELQERSDFFVTNVKIALLEFKLHAFNGAYGIRYEWR